jgi:hypothetical protein
MTKTVSRAGAGGGDEELKERERDGTKREAGALKSVRKRRGVIEGKRETAKQIDPHGWKVTKIKESSPQSNRKTGQASRDNDIGSIRPSRRLNSILMSPLIRLLSQPPLPIDRNASQLFFLDNFGSRSIS